MLFLVISKQQQQKTKQKNHKNQTFNTEPNLDYLRSFFNLLNVKVGTDEVLNKYLVEELPKRLSIDLPKNTIEWKSRKRFTGMELPKYILELQPAASLVIPEGTGVTDN